MTSADIFRQSDHPRWAGWRHVLIAWHCDTPHILRYLLHTQHLYGVRSSRPGDTWHLDATSWSGNVRAWLVTGGCLWGCIWAPSGARRHAAAAEWRVKNVGTRELFPDTATRKSPPSQIIEIQQQQKLPNCSKCHETSICEEKYSFYPYSPPPHDTRLWPS